jgi:spore maturation protein CgeB
LIASGITLDIYAHILTIEPVDLFFRRSAYIVAKMLSTIGLQGVAKSLPFVQKAHYLEEMPSNPVHVDAIKAIAKPSVYGLEMFKALSHAKIAFNYHGEGSGEYACNVRLFEVTGAGSCLITDWKKNLHELFELDTEIVTFRSASECIEKVQWLLDHPNETAEIARRGQKRALRDHNYRIRAEILHKIILNNLR